MHASEAMNTDHSTISRVRDVTTRATYTTKIVINEPTRSRERRASPRWVSRERPICYRAGNSRGNIDKRETAHGISNVGRSKFIRTHKISGGSAGSRAISVTVSRSSPSKGGSRVNKTKVELITDKGSTSKISRRRRLERYLNSR